LSQRAGEALRHRKGTAMTEILDIVCKGTVIVGPSYETLDVVCKGSVVIIGGVL
jgi:hypothetical protein